MKKRNRLVNRSEFQRLLSGRRLYSGESLVGFAAAGRSAVSRVGVASSRQIKGAVSRNRARRRLREAARLTLIGEDSIEAGAGITFDVVLIARPAALTASFASLRSELGKFRARLGSAG